MVQVACFSWDPADKRDFSRSVRLVSTLEDLKNKPCFSRMSPERELEKWQDECGLRDSFLGKEPDYSKDSVGSASE